MRGAAVEVVVVVVVVVVRMVVEGTEIGGYAIACATIVAAVNIEC